MTAEEVGARLRLPLSTVYHLAKKGELRGIQLGRSWRFRTEDIDALTECKRPRPRILVVDADEGDCALVADVLQPRNCVVVGARNVEEGLAAAKLQRFDLLLVDFGLPGRSGTELIHALAGEYSLSQIVVITAYPHLVQLDQVFHLGAVTLLRKPLRADQLVECVERMLATRLPRVCSGGEEKVARSGSGCETTNARLNQDFRPVEP